MNKCSRTACNSIRLTHRHTQTNRLYCARCAKGINEYHPGLVVPTLETQIKIYGLDKPINREQISE